MSDEFDVTHMMNDREEMINLSGSIAEHGSNACQITWENSLRYAKKHPLLETDEHFEFAREYFRSLGAWPKSIIDAMNRDTLQAMTVQHVASCIREIERYDSFAEYREASEAGDVQGGLYVMDDGRAWYNFGV